MVAAGKAMYNHSLEPLKQFMDDNLVVFECLTKRLMGNTRCAGEEGENLREGLAVYGRTMTQLLAIVGEQLLNDVKQDLTRETSLLQQQLKTLEEQDRQKVSEQLNIIVGQVKPLEHEFYATLNNFNPQTLKLYQLNDDIFKLKDPTIQAIGLIKGVLHTITDEMTKAGL